MIKTWWAWQKFFFLSVLMDMEHGYISIKFQKYATYIKPFFSSKLLMNLRKNLPIYLWTFAQVRCQWIWFVVDFIAFFIWHNGIEKWPPFSFSVRRKRKSLAICIVYTPFRTHSISGLIMLSNLPGHFSLSGQIFFALGSSNSQNM